MLIIVNWEIRTYQRCLNKSACYIVEIRTMAWSETGHGGIYHNMQAHSSYLICPKTSAKLIIPVGIFVDVPTWGDSWQYFPNMKLMILALNGVFIDTKKHSFSLLQKMHFNTLFCIMRYTSVSAFPLRNSLLILNSFKLLLPLSVFWNDVEIKLHCKQFQIVSF